MAEEESDDRERRRQEFLALDAIFTGVIGDDADGPWQVPLDVGEAILEVHLPQDYPSVSAPTPLLFAPTVSEAQSSALCAELLEQFEGMEIVFTWANHLNAALAAFEDTEDPEEAAAAGRCALEEEGDETEHAICAVEASSKSQGGTSSGFTFTPSTSKYGQRVRHFASNVDDPSLAVEITSGGPYHPPKSGPGETFQAHVARVASMEQVHWCLAQLLRDKRIARATHNMIAYRFKDEARGGVQVADNDDDGESSSGAKLAALLELTSCQNVLVVVSRWFGGVLLGPARFKYIASTARALLEEAGHVGSAGAAGRAPGGPKSKNGGARAKG